MILPVAPINQITQSWGLIAGARVGAARVFDVLETEREVLVLAALPGVDVAQVEATIEGATLVIAGQRTLPPELHAAVIHRMELPQGRFERRVSLPPGRYDGVRRAEAHGCLVISLSKLKP